MLERRMILSAWLLLALGLGLGASAPAHTAAQMGAGSPPLEQLAGDAFDQAFLREMSMHHAMAVVMARPVVANAQHQELRDLAATIVEDQTREIALMRGWLRDWYGVDLPDPVAQMDAMAGSPMPLGGMDHGATPGGQGGMMGGMHQGELQGGQQGMIGSTDHSAHMAQGGMMGGMQHSAHMAQGGVDHSAHMGQGGAMGSQGMPSGHGHDVSMLADLWKLPPARLEAVFLSMMIPHHQGAIDMSVLTRGRAAHGDLRALAEQIIASQAAEIDQMNRWLAAWYGL